MQQLNMINSIKIKHKSRKFNENKLLKPTKDYITNLVEEAFNSFRYDYPQGTEIYLDLGSELPYQGFMSLKEVTGTSLVFNTVYPDHLELSDVIDLSDITPKHKDKTSIENALSEAENIDSYELDEALAYAMSANGYISEVKVLFSDLDYDFDIEFDENGISKFRNNDDFEAFKESLIDYIKLEVETYRSDVAREVSSIVEDINQALEKQIERLKEELEDIKVEENINHRKTRRINNL